MLPEHTAAGKLYWQGRIVIWVNCVNEALSQQQQSTDNGTLLVRAADAAQTGRNSSLTSTASYCRQYCGLAARRLPALYSQQFPQACNAAILWWHPAC